MTPTADDLIAPHPPRRSRRNDAIFWILWGFAFLVGVSIYVPLLQKQVDVNAEWLIALSIAYLRGLSFGREVVFTYGPLGFCAGGYWPATFKIMLLVWAFLATATWLSLWSITRKLKLDRRLALTVVFAIFILASGEHDLLFDCRAIFLSVLLIAFHFLADDRPMSAVKLLLIAAIAVAGMIKFSFLIAGVVACATVTLHEILCHRKPLSLPLLAVAYLVLWMLCGQHIGDWPAYLRSSIELTRGYSAAMSLSTDREAVDVARFLAPAVALLVLAWRASVSRSVSRVGQIIHLTGASFLLWMCFKAGFVRHDVHEIVATNILPMIAATYLLMLNRREWWLGVATLLLAIYASSVSYSNYAQTGLPSRAGDAFASAARESREVIRLIGGNPAASGVQFNAWLNQQREQSPLPKVSGSSDLFMIWNYFLPANDLDYLPRPTIGSYVTYAPMLADANAAFLRGLRAPENLFFALETFDNRLLALDDGRAMLEIAARYDLVAAAGAYLQFHRSPAARRVIFDPLGEISASFMQPIAIPFVGGDVIWAEIDFTPTLQNQIISLLYKPPPLYVMPTTADGRQQDVKRLISGCARSGFVISPLLRTTQDFAATFSPNARALPFPPCVQSITIGGAGGTLPVEWFNPSFRVKLYRVTFAE